MGITKWRRYGKVSWRIEFKWQDLWLGLFVQRPKLVGGIDFYVCLVPMFPLHIGWNRTIEAKDYGTYEYRCQYVDRWGNPVTWDGIAKKWIGGGAAHSRVDYWDIA